MNSNDYELLYMIYQMDESSLQVFVKKYRDFIYRHLKRYVWHKNLERYREDIMLDAISLLYQSIYSYRDDQNTQFLTYFYCVLDRCLASFYRRVYRDHLTSHGEYIELDRFVEDTHAYQVDQFRNKDVTLEGVYYLYMANYYEMLNKILIKLQPKEREIVLARIDGYTYEEIAKIVKVDEKKVDNTLQKVRNLKV